MIRRMLKGAGVWALTMGLCIALLWTVCAAIPQSSIQQGSEQSADFFSAHEPLPRLNEAYHGTQVDHFSDSLLFNIIYHIDSSSAFDSMVRAEMHRDPTRDCREDYRSSVYDGAEPSMDYSRYWHGAQVLIRPLLTFTSYEGCRIILFGLLMALNAALAVRLVRGRALRALGIYAVGMLLINFWIALFAIQYVTTLLVSSTACVAVAWLWGKDMPVMQRMRRMTVVCIVSGVWVCFLDFLTCETVAFTVPAILWLMLYAEQAHERLQRRTLAGSVCRWGGAWLGAYAAAFAVKWLLVLALMGQDAFLQVFSRASIRFDRVLDVVGNTAAYNVRETGMGLMLARNLSCLLPGATHMTVNGVLVISAGIAALAGLGVYLRCGRETDGALLVCLLLVALVPFLRFVVLASHSLDHYFYTYRALIATVMALAAMLVYAAPRRKRPARR